MRNTLFSSSALKHAAKRLVPATLALGLAACGSDGGLPDFFDGGQSTGPAQTQVSPSGATTIGGVSVQQLQADQLCPTLIVREGTDILRLYSGEDRTASNVRYQSQILQTAIECTPAVGQFALSVGIAGRSIIGPQGSAATLDLPIRIVVLNTLTREVVSSEIRTARAVIEPGEVSTTFTIVDRSFVVPAPQRQADFQVLVGFDEAET